MSFRKTLAWGIPILLVVVFLFVLAQPMVLKSIQARYKSTDHFSSLEEDRRIHYETPAKRNALILAKTLTDSQKQVEDILGASMKSPLKVYICATQESFNEYVFLSKRAKGAVYWGKLFLSPAAFTDASLGELVTHELTHFLFYSHLGERKHIQQIPLWFREGIAVFVANGGSEYTRENGLYARLSEQERSVLLSGQADIWFTDQPATAAVTSDGSANWLLYRIGALFIHYISEERPAAFSGLVRLLLSGTGLGEALNRTYGASTDELLGSFKTHIGRQPLSVVPDYIR